MIPRAQSLDGLSTGSDITSFILPDSVAFLNRLEIGEAFVGRISNNRDRLLFYIMKLKS